MKKKILLGLLAVSVLSFNFCGVSLAGSVDVNNQTGIKIAAATEPDLNTMKANSTQLILSVGLATFAFAESAIVILRATGEKELAEKLKLKLDEAKKNPKDEEGIKNFVSAKETNEAMEKLSKTKLDASKKVNLSQAELTSALLNFGAGVICDTFAVTKATALVKDATAMLDKAQKDPMKYGFSAAGTLNSVIGSGKFICDNVPSQIKDIQAFTTQLTAYCKANKITVSEKDIKAKADTMQKG